MIEIIQNTFFKYNRIRLEMNNKKKVEFVELAYVELK